MLVPAGSPATCDLRGRPVVDVLAAGRPLRCLGGCRCTGKPRSATAWAAVGAFISANFPEHEPAPPGTPPPDGLRRVEINAARYRLGQDPSVERAQPPRRAPDSGGARESLLIVRLGRQAPSPEPGRTHIGYDASMSRDELRDAARMYWRLDPRRAEGLTHLVAASGRKPVEAYVIVPDSLTYTTSPDGSRRAAFELREVGQRRLRAQLLRRAADALGRLSRGAQNPVLYGQG